MNNDEIIKENILTKEGKTRLEEELRQLVKIDRPAVIKEIKEAREQGDLSENAEFDAARQRQGIIEDRITEIESILNESKVIKSVTKNTKNIVHIGSEVELIINNGTKPTVVTIVGSIEANPLDGKISNLSPIAKAIMGKEVGYQVTVEDAKNKPKVKIVKIHNNN